MWGDGRQFEGVRKWHHLMFFAMHVYWERRDGGNKVLGIEHNVRRTIFYPSYPVYPEA